MTKKVLILVGFFILFRLSGTLLANVAAENYHKRALTEFDKGNYEQAVIYADKSIKYNVIEPTYFVDRAKFKIAYLAIKLSQENLDQAERELISTAAKIEILQDINKAIDLNTQNLVTKRNVMPIIYFLSFKDLSSNLDTSNLEEEYLAVARDYFIDIVKAHSNDLGVLAQAAQYQKNLSLSADFENTKNRINDIRPEILEWYIK